MHRIVTWSATAALALSPLALAATTAQASASTGSASSAFSGSSAKQKARSYKVRAKANLEMAVAREDKVKVRGKVAPKAAGQKVLLQQRVGDKKKWKKTGSAKIKRNGTFLLKDKPTTPGTREYRVLKPGSRGIRKGVSKPMPVVVYAWEALGYRAVGPKVNVAVTGTNIGTEYYAGSLVTETAGTPSSIEYTLGRKCVSLRSTYALTDTAATGSTGSIVVSTDGTTRATHALAVGTVVADQVNDLTGTYRLKFDLTTSASPAGVAAVAHPEVLCTR